MEKYKTSFCYYNTKNYRFALYSYSDEPEIIYLSNVFVNEDCRGRGFGNNILQKAAEEARATGGSYLRLKCLSTSWMHVWYKKHGFSDLCADKDESYFWMEKKI